MPIRKRGFSLNTLPPREKVLKHNLKNAKKDLSRVEKKLKRLYNLDDRPGVIMLNGPSPEIQIASLEDERTGLIQMIKEIKKELDDL